MKAAKAKCVELGAPEDDFKLHLDYSDMENLDSGEVGDAADGASPEDVVVDQSVVKDLVRMNLDQQSRINRLVDLLENCSLSVTNPFLMSSTVSAPSASGGVTSPPGTIPPALTPVTSVSTGPTPVSSVSMGLTPALSTMPTSTLSTRPSIAPVFGSATTTPIAPHVGSMTSARVGYGPTLIPSISGHPASGPTAGAVGHSHGHMSPAWCQPVSGSAAYLMNSPLTSALSLQPGSPDVDPTMRVELDQIDGEMSNLIGMAWSRNTLLTRNSQWKKFLNFCISIGASPVPADPITVCRYLVYLSSTCKYVTLNNHLSAICVLHRFYGYVSEFRECFVVKLVLSGVKSKYGNASAPKMCLSLPQLCAMYNVLPVSELNFTLWTAVIFSFRTLLRKCNLVQSTGSDHMLRRADIRFSGSGATVTVGSTKTLRHKERLLLIPLSWVRNPGLCVVSRLMQHFADFPAPPSSPIFLKRTRAGLVPVTYKDLLSFIKECVARIGLDPGNVGFHSLRRSGATHLHSIVVPLIDIKFLGDWKSLAVLQYLVTTLERKVEIENYFASTL